VKAPLWLRIVSLSGFLVSVLAGFYTLIPITPVEQPWGFALKILAVVVIANAVGAVLYLIRGKRNTLASQGQN
jgi:hypothetical protein